VTIRLIQVNVIVQDSKGNPISDLTRDDFLLLDEGQEQEIRIFSLESSHRFPVLREPLPPNTFSNRSGQHTGALTSATAILLDGINTAVLDQARAKEELIRFLEHLQPQDRVALYTLSDQLRVLHDFTDDAAPLLETLKHYKGQPSAYRDEPKKEPDTKRAQLDAWMRLGEQMARHEEDLFWVQRVERTAEALEAISNHLAGLPGRKNLIWVSAGFPITLGFEELSERADVFREWMDKLASGGDVTVESAQLEALDSFPRMRHDFSRAIERVARALNHANLAIYPVDARGLRGPFDTDPALMQPWARIKGGIERPRFQTVEKVWGSIDTMEQLAERTGGRAFYNTNDIAKAVRSAIDDTRLTYVLGYYPSHNVWDGKFRGIKVQVKRPGLRVRHRRGYFALGDKPLDEKQTEVLLREAARSPMEASGLGLTARVEKTGDPASQMTLRVRLQIAPNDITLDLFEGFWIGRLEIMLVQRDAEGQELWSDFRVLNLRLPTASYERVERQGLILNRRVRIAAGANEVRFCVRDARSGALGSVHIPLGQLLR